MTRKRNIGRAAALGGLTATVALLTGLPAASADELADLRANQELLQRRIDQLAQAGGPTPAPGVPGGYGTQPIPGQPIIGGSFPRSFLIPGTDTSIRVGGFIDATVDYYLQNGPPNGNQSTTVGINGNLPVIPLNVHMGTTVPGFPTNIPGSGTVAPGTPAGLVPQSTASSRGNGVFLISPRETRLNVETRTPTAWGESRTFIEFDFAGTNNFSGQSLTAVSDNLIPRLRYAYGTLGGFLAGQANSNFSDPDANSETLDFGGPPGQAGVVRIPQVRYTYAGPYGSAWSISAETPETDIVTPAGNVKSDSNTQALPGGPGGIVNATAGCVANGILISPSVACTLAGNPTKASAPDITFASYWSQPWGHVDFRGVVRPTLTVNDGHLIDKTFVGYGGGISGDVKPWAAPPFGMPGTWEKDDFQFQFTAGSALGRYLNDGADAALATNFLTSPATAAAAGNILVERVREFGYQVGYQHWWVPNLRSNLVYGFSYYAYPSQLIGPTQSIVSNKQLQGAWINLIWSPVAFVDTGIEYTWQQRQTVANLKGQQQALIGKFRVKF
ncbi:MAG: porin [Alphaproteobacteria bacterium]|nr:porin [Alphaproteobacteria bacterium]